MIIFYVNIQFFAIWSVSRRRLGVTHSEFRYINRRLSGQGSFIVVADSQPKGVRRQHDEILCIVRYQEQVAARASCSWMPTGRVTYIVDQT